MPIPRVAEHKNLFFKTSWARYEEAVKGSLRIVPPEHRVKSLREDYARMEQMFFGEDAVTNDFASRTVGTIDYVWIFPRKLLPGQTAAGIFDAKRLPFAFLSGDGKLARQILEIAEKNHLRLDICMELESFSLLVETGFTFDLPAFVEFLKNLC